MPILKSLILLLFLSVSAFSETYTIVSNPYQSEFKRTNLEPVSSDLFRLLKGDSYVYYKIRDSFPDVYYFNTDTGMTGGVYEHSTGHYFLESSPSFKSVCGRPRTYNSFTFRDCDSKNTPDGNWWFSISARKANKFILNEVGTCKTDEDFNTVTGQCQKCASNESWDPDTQKCYRDCSKDGGINKIGNTDGSCIDCSGEKTPLAVLKCICRGYGNESIDPKFWGKNNSSLDSCYLEGTCGDGSTLYSFTNPNCKSDDPKPDDNKTKPDTPKPDDNKTKPDTPSPNPGGGNPGGGNPGGGSGGSQDDPKPKPNDPGVDNGNNEGKGKDPKFSPGDFDAKDLGNEMSSFQKAYKGAISQIEKNFSGSEGFNSFKDGIDQFINNLKGRGLSDVSKQSVPKTCSHKENIDFFGHTITMDFDFCKIISPASGAFYYLFYVFFFGCFLFLIIKFLIFSF